MAYTADINIVVKGQAAVDTLQKSLIDVAKEIDELAKKRIGPTTTLDTFNKQLQEAAKHLKEVAAGTSLEKDAIRNYVTALGNANAATERQNKLIQAEIDLREASTKNIKELADVQTYLYEQQRKLENSKLDAKAAAVQAALDKQVVATRELANVQAYLYEQQRKLENSKLDAKAAAIQAALDKQAAATRELANVQTYLYEQQRKLENSKLDAKAAVIQAALDKQAAAAAESAAQTEKLNQRQAEFIARTDAAAQAAARQTAEFYRLQRISKQLNAIKPTADAGFGIQGPAAPRPIPRPKPGENLLKKPGVADALIGGSFPLLFGGGPGATIGGALGGLAGGAMGNPLGMALSLALSAVGQQLDAAIAKVVEMQKALDALDIDKLRDSFVYVNAQLDYTVQKLIEAGKIEEARAVAAEEVARQTGAIGSSIKDSANATNLLGAAWNEYLGAISTSLSLLGAPFAAALALILKGFTLITQAVNTITSAIGQGLKSAFESFIRLFPGGDQLLKNMAKTFNIITEEEQKLIAQLKLANAVTERQIVLNRELLGLQTRLTLGRTQAEKEINAAVNAQIAQKQINADFDVKAIELRKQYGGIAALFGQKELELALLNNEAKRAQALEEQKIKDLLVQQALELEANAQKYEAVRQSINLQVEALDRANSVRQSALSLQSALNDLYGAQLEREYRLATTSEQRLQIALKQFQQQVNAAKIEYEQATLNNKLLVDKAYLQTQLIKLRYEELAAEKEIAIAQAIARKNTDEEIAKIAAGYDRALGVQEQIVAAAEEQLGSTIEIAANQDSIAKAVYDTKVLSAEAALAQKLSSEEIGMSKKEANDLATYMSNVAQEAVTSQKSVSNLNKSISDGTRQSALMAKAMEGVASAATRAAIEIGKAVAKQRELNAARGGSPVTLAPAAEGAFWPGGFKAFAQGGVVNRPTMGLIGEGGESEYIVPESKAAGFATNYLFGQRGAAAIPDAGNTDGSAGTPVINITTGPVVEFNGQRYVTLADMEQAMRVTASSVISRLRTPGYRTTLGIS